jgi:CubicO group peptidase (beta-lactamase class C family)
METYPVTATPPPGTQYSYSTVNYIVAARIVEQLTGQSVNAYIKKKLFLPLEMRNSFFIAQPTGVPAVDARIDEGTTAEQRARVADVALITRNGELPVEFAPGPGNRIDQLRRGWRLVNPDGGMYSTASDLLNFLGMLSEGGLFRSRRVLSPRIVRLLVQDQGHSHTMGFGFRRRTTPYGQVAGTLEHMGFKMTYFWLEPRLDDPLIGVFLSQRLPNIAVNTNLADGMNVIFNVFVPLVRGEPLKVALQEPA